MENMFYEANTFNQDLSGWCVSLITSEPSNFSTNSALIAANKPNWGTCTTLTKINGQTINDSSTRWNINHWSGMVSSVTNKSTVNTLELSNILYKINSNGFRNCNNLTSLIMYFQGEIDLTEYSFHSCTNLSSITLYCSSISYYSTPGLVFVNLPPVGLFYAMSQTIFDTAVSIGLPSSWIFVQI
jgi:hypothetical protein